jgi:hypothetical protein
MEGDLTAKQLRAKIVAAIGDRLRKDWAAEVRVSASVLSDVLNGRRDPPSTILEALGYERVIIYRPSTETRDNG